MGLKGADDGDYRNSADATKKQKARKKTLATAVRARVSKQTRRHRIGELADSPPEKRSEGL